MKRAYQVAAVESGSPQGNSSRSAGRIWGYNDMRQVHERSDAGRGGKLKLMMPSACMVRSFTNQPNPQDVFCIANISCVSRVSQKRPHHDIMEALKSRRVRLDVPSE
jgi:hypothetical protein